MASSGVMDMDTEYSEDQSHVFSTPKGKKGKGKDLKKAAYELLELTNAVNNDFSTEGLTTTLLIIAQGYQIRNLIVMLQNFSTLFQEHLAGIGRERKGKAGLRPTTKKLSKEKTKSYTEAATGGDPETPPKRNKKNKGKRKADDGPTPQNYQMRNKPKETRAAKAQTKRSGRMSKAKNAKILRM
ncbi:hypothetical protein HOY80DRAFT_1044988 [Tuber brumale]|nr:hypothetical protein HOY80DRAFT_1044988 [Tuber brumale]